MKRFRTAMFVTFASIIMALVFFGAQLQVPTVLAFPNLGGFNPAMPTGNTCAVSGCHAGTISPTSATISFPSGMTTYTPGGPAVPLTLMVPGSSFGTWGYQLSARLASNLASAGGFFSPGDNGTTGSTGGSPSFSLTWTPPPAGTTDSVNFYLTGDNTAGVGSNNIFSTAMATLTPAASTPPPTPAPDFSLSASPYTLTQGGNGSDTITVTPQNGFTGNVTLSASNLPTGSTASSFNPASTMSTSLLTLTASSTAATGTFSVTITGTSGSLSHTATLSLTVNPVSSGTGTLAVSPAALTFNYRMGGRMPGSKKLAITSASGPTSYSATETDPWLSIAPVSGSTPGNLRASINPAGMAAGTYGAQINISTPNGTTTTVPVSLTITSGSGGGGTPGGLYAQPYLSDSQSGTLAAAWVDYLGASPNNSSDPRNRGLVLATSANSPSGAVAGAVIQGVSGMNLTELSFDFRADIPCTSGSPLFQVVTMNGTTNTYGGCKSNPTTPATSAPMGWTHVQFDLTQAPSTTSSLVQSISLVLQQGSSSTGSIAVIDNIQINRVPVGKGAASTPNPRDD